MTPESFPFLSLGLPPCTLSLFPVFVPPCCTLSLLPVPYPYLLCPLPPLCTLSLLTVLCPSSLRSVPPPSSQGRERVPAKPPRGWVAGEIMILTMLIASWKAGAGEKPSPL
jgi:hypothetical protein